MFAAKEIKERVRVDGIRSWLAVDSPFVPKIIGIVLQQTICYILQVGTLLRAFLVLGSKDRQRNIILSPLIT